MTPKRVHWREVAKLFARGLQAGATRTGPTRIEWDISGNCQSPNVRELFARPPSPEARRVILTKWSWDIGAEPTPHIRPGRMVTRSPVTGPRSAHLLVVCLSTRCRKCDKCRVMRRLMWTNRAAVETRNASRTWFGTITLSPEEHVMAAARARHRLAKQGLDFDALPYGEQFVLRHNAVSPLLTKYLKRLRKASGAQIRFLLVAEAHKSGLPHYHALVHEVSAADLLRHAVLTKQWPHGFTKWKLVDDVRQATYLCKYLSKSTAARVRASRRYGSLGDPIQPPEGKRTPQRGAKESTTKTPLH